MKTTNTILTPWSRETSIAYVRSQISAGMRTTSAKLRPAEVDEIRDLLAEGQMTQREIADRYHVCRMTICGINTGKAWKRAA